MFAPEALEDVLPSGSIILYETFLSKTKDCTNLQESVSSMEKDFSTSLKYWKEKRNKTKQKYK